MSISIHSFASDYFFVMTDCTKVMQLKEYLFESIRKDENRRIQLVTYKHHFKFWQNRNVKLNIKNSKANHVRWVPCHHGMARPQVADGGDAIQVWKEAANILNKQSRTADKGWS
jgi:hypothetical protein